MATISTPRTQSPAPPRVQSPIISQSPAGTPASSVRPSLELPIAEGRAVSPAPPNAAQRRNRAALRDYYNLKSQIPPHGPLSRTASIASTTSNGTTSTLAALDDPSSTSALISQLDQADFNAEAYVQDLLASSSLKTVLKAEGSLVSEIKNLDGERKALVYDNYSKLITATQTIGTMRKSMDDAGEGSLRSINRLAKAVDTVAKSAAELTSRGTNHDQTASRRRRQERSKRDTVRWVLDTPSRLQQNLAQGKRADAEADWGEISLLLDNKFAAVKGTAELRDTCEAIMSQSSTNDTNGAGNLNRNG